MLREGGLQQVTKDRLGAFGKSWTPYAGYGKPLQCLREKDFAAYFKKGGGRLLWLCKDRLHQAVVGVGRPERTLSQQSGKSWGGSRGANQCFSPSSLFILQMILARLLLQFIVCICAIYNQRCLFDKKCAVYSRGLFPPWTLKRSIPGVLIILADPWIFLVIHRPFTPQSIQHISLPLMLFVFFIALIIRCDCTFILAIIQLLFAFLSRL